jgi:hypothetical protein
MRFENLAVAVAAVMTLSTLCVPAPAEAQVTIPTQAIPAQAQPPATQPSPAPFDRRDCPPGVGNGAGAPGPRSNETTGSRSLSEQLSESKGVICPPSGVDPGIAVPPVGGGRMPVIPPPGTPGGDPNVVPKQ